MTPTPTPFLIEQGPATASPIVMLHGWGASSDLFAPHLPLLAEYRLLVPDFPGFGKTAEPPEAWAVGDYAQWLLDLLDQRGIQQAHFIGHSFGGRVAIKIAANHPERVAKLVLTGSAGIRPRRSLAYHARVRTFKFFKWVTRSEYLPEALRRMAQARSEQLGSSDYQQSSGTLKGTFIRVVNEDLRDLLPQITAPTLLVWGSADHDTPLADGKLMEQLIPDAGLVVFDDAGHYAYLEQSARFCTIVQHFFGQARSHP